MNRPSFQIAAREHYFVNTDEFAVAADLRGTLVDFAPGARLPVRYVANTRDLGGHRNRQGQTIKRGSILRSDAMTALDEQDLAWIDAIGFGSSVDMRNQSEEERAPSQFGNRPGYHHMPVDLKLAPGSLMELAQTAGLEEIEAHLVEITTRIPSAGLHALKQLFSNLLELEPPHYFNCVAGKDRTGVAAALIMEALDFDRDQITTEYMRSAHYLRTPVEKVLAALVETDEVWRSDLRRDAMFTALLVHESALQATLEKLENTYGSVKAYLESELGVGDAEIQELKHRYLETA